MFIDQLIFTFSLEYILIRGQIKANALKERVVCEEGYRERTPPAASVPPES